jgi:starvation-inducible DNA-binding protein
MAQTRAGARQVPLPLAREARERLSELLVTASLELRDLELCAKVAHWNVRGVLFSALHPFFDGLAEHLDGWVDMTAERAVTLGGYARGRSQDVAEAAPIAPYPTDAVDGEAHVRALLARYERVAADLRHAIGDSERLGDPDTVDLFTEVSRGLEKDLWMLEAHLGA